MTWNLRLVKHTDRKFRRTWYGVHEVFYTDSGKPWLMTENPVEIEGDTPEEVRRYLGMIRRDLKRLPMLDADKVKWARFRALKRRGARKAYATTDEVRRRLDRLARS
jgi:hypothetical protein